MGTSRHRDGCALALFLIVLQSISAIFAASLSYLYFFLQHLHSVCITALAMLCEGSIYYYVAHVGTGGTCSDTKTHLWSWLLNLDRFKVSHTERWHQKCRQI